MPKKQFPSKNSIRGITQPAPSFLKAAVLGLQASENAKLSSSLIQTIKRAIVQNLPRKTEVFVTCVPTVPVSKKPSETRMGKGKGSFSTTVARVRCGDLIFQI